MRQMNIASVTEYKDHFTVVTEEGRSFYLNKTAYYAVHRYFQSPPVSVVELMKRGRTEVETLRLNGWTIGDILEGDEGYGPDRITITAIGDERFLCTWDYKCAGTYADESGSTTLNHREWKKVGESNIHKGNGC